MLASRRPVLRRIARSLAARALAAGALGAALASAPARAGLPAEGDCPTVTGGVVTDEQGRPRDAASVTLKEGMVLGIENLLVLRELLPTEIWSHRDVFFFEGMRMEVGPCHRRYVEPGFLKEATARFAKDVSLDARGNLSGYTAGVPFPPDAIDPEAEDAAQRFAWNLALRFAGGGHRGHFRVVDFSEREGDAQTYEGDAYFLPTRGRADLAATGYAVEGSGDTWWIAGGHFTKPFQVRHLAWRQFRPAKTWTSYEEPDDTFVYVPSMRKSRRASTAWVDGLYFPTYAAAGPEAGGSVAFGGDLGVSISPTAGRSAAASAHAYKGFEGMMLRPNAYKWRLLGMQDVMAPINGTSSGYPIDPNRNFGPAGLSVASDRWEVRRAAVIEGAIRRDDEGLRTVMFWVDAQTGVPLYRVSRAGRRRILDVQIFVHRFSGDQPGYPEWPGGTPALVFEPVAEVSFDALAGAGGWRRESYDVVSLPFDRDDLPGLTSSAALERGR